MCRCMNREAWLAAMLMMPLAGLPCAVAQRTIRPHCPIQEEIWALPLPLPMFAYLVRPVGDGPFPLVIMNHGVSLDPIDRSFFPLVEFRDAAKWFAQRGYLVVAPVGTGYGAAAIDIPEQGLYGPFFSKVGKCSNPNFRRSRPGGCASRPLDHRLHGRRKAHGAEGRHRRRAVRRRMGLDRAFKPEPAARSRRSSSSPPAVAAASTASRITIARRTNWWRRPRSSAAHRACRCFGSTSRTIRSSALPCRSACTTLLPPPAARPNTIWCRQFGNEGHFFIGSPDAIPIWSPMVAKFLESTDRTRAGGQA